MNAQEEILGLTNLYNRLASLIGRKITRDEQRKLSVIHDDCLIFDNFSVSLKTGTFCSYLISKIE
jgi:hypothetical protein